MKRPELDLARLIPAAGGLLVVQRAVTSAGRPCAWFGLITPKKGREMLDVRDAVLLDLEAAEARRVAGRLLEVAEELEPESADELYARLMLLLGIVAGSVGAAGWPALRERLAAQLERLR
jgi:hypothetical protein